MSLPRPDFSAKNTRPIRSPFIHKFTISQKSKQYPGFIAGLIDQSFIIADDKKGYVGLYFVAKIRKDLITFKLREFGLRGNRELYIQSAKLVRDHANSHGYEGMIKKLI